MGKEGSLLKRAVDIAGSLFIILLASPVLLISAVAIKIESSGPVIFKHERTGLGGKKFLLYKFRGMVDNALAVGPELTQVNDPRITKVGKFLRRTSIDEIPNFFNVLKGDMCLVGPRPDIPSITDKYNEKQREIFNYKPGVTGYSQVNGRQMLTPDERIEMELEYYRSANILSDFAILIKTLKVIITNEGNI